MPHLRQRHLRKLILKRKKLWPVIGVLGARQVGKSTLLREQLSVNLKAKYITLDRKENLSRAVAAPSLFVSMGASKTEVMIIDEIQKAPELFDAIKAEVDENRIPGRYFISGSTEFSSRFGIRESLTGRIGISYLYPLTVSELYERNLKNFWVENKPKSQSSLHEVMKWVERGGMPGACFLRDELERSNYFENYLDTVCFRDLLLIKKEKLNGQLALDILRALAMLARPTIAELSRCIKVDSRKIKSHVDTLVSLFLIHPLRPHASGTGKERYIIFDSGLAQYLGAPLSKRLQIMMLNECLAQSEYIGLGRPRIYYYETAKHSFVDFVIETNHFRRAIIISEDEAPGKYYDKTVAALLKKIPKSDVFVLAPVKTVFKTQNYQAVPWNYFC